MTEHEQRRAHPRTHCTIPIVIERNNPRMLSSALMLNYSDGGLYFEISAPLETGDYIKVNTDDNSVLDPVSRDAWKQRRAEVRWCREIEISGSRRYGCGVQYLSVTGI